MREEGKKRVETWLEGHEALIDINDERLSSFVPEVHEPEVQLPEPRPNRNWLLIAAVFMALLLTVAFLYWGVGS